MTRTRLFLLSTLAAALVSSSPAQAAVSKVVTYSGYLKTAAGVPVTASTDITFRLYTAPSGGAAIWNDSVSVTPGTDGWFSAPLGILNPLPLSILGQDLYLSLQVGADAEFAQRARVTPSGAALTVDWSGVQGKPTCAAGQFLSLESATGNLVCQTPAASGGFTPPSCSSGQVMKWSGTAWACAADDSGAAALVHDASLAGTGVAGSPLGIMACADNQILQRVAGAWSCTPTPSGGGGVTAISSGTGLTGGPITTTGTISIDPTVVPQLGVASNTFTGTVAATGGFVGNLTGNASTATAATTANTASGVAAGAITPSDLNAAGAPATGQVPAKTSGTDSFTWLSPVTSVSGNPPVSVGGTAAGPVISVSQASGTTPGFVSAADWTAFSGKQAAINGGPCTAGSYVTNVNATTGAVTCGPGTAFKVNALRGLTTVAATGVTNVNSISFTAPSAGTVLATASGYCNLSTGAAATYHMLVGTSASDQAVCGYGFIACLPPGCDWSFCGFHEFPAAATPSQSPFFVQRVVGVAAGANTLYLNVITNGSGGPGSCSGMLTATFEATSLP